VIKHDIFQSGEPVGRMSSKGVRSPSTQPSLARESPMGGLPAMEDEEDFFKFSSDDCSDTGLSGEETDDASENECYQNTEYSQFTEIKEQMYQDKLAHLKRQLQQLAEGTHADWLRKVKRLDQQYKERMRINSVVKELELEMVEEDYQNEKKNAAREFEEKKVYLKEQLIVQLEDKQRMIEQERTSMELTGDSMELKPVITRKLRRRANEPSNGNGYARYGPGEKRRKIQPGGLSYLLEEREVEDDLRIINKTLAQSSKSSALSPPPAAAAPTFARDARIEDGKLFYEKRWFRRGQTIYVEGKDGSSYGATISAIGSDAIWVRRVEDSSKVSIYLSQLNKGKFQLKRRAQ